MAADMNQVNLVGRLTRDPELRHTQSGDGICNLRVAVTGRGRDESGSWVDKPNFFDVTVFGRQAESVAQYLGKGRRVGVSGRLQWREWTQQDGSVRQAVDVVANDVYFLDSGQGVEAGHTPPRASELPAPPAPKPTLADYIPF